MNSLHMDTTTGTRPTLKLIGVTVRHQDAVLGLSDVFTGVYCPPEGPSSTLRVLAVPP